MNAQDAGALTLRLERVIRADRARVFAAWTEPEQLARWSSPEGLTVEDGELDLRVGGKWRVVMAEANGVRHEAFGTYREVTPPSRLVYTHAWAREAADGIGSSPQTIVTVALETTEPGVTRVVLTQEGFATPQSRDGHNGGWSSALDHLEALFAA